MTKKVASNRFQKPAEAPAILGFSQNEPGVYTKKDEYGFHLLRVLPCRQEILYTVTDSGMVVEKINFVPTKTPRPGNAAYGSRWQSVLEYRRSDDHAEDFAVLAENGMAMAPETRSKAPSKASGWTKV